MSFNERLRRSRRKARITQAQLAAKVGVDRHTVIRWEAAESGIPGGDQVRKCADLLGVSPGWLMGLRTDPSPPMYLTQSERKLIELARKIGVDGADKLIAAYDGANDAISKARCGG